MWLQEQFKAHLLFFTKCQTFPIDLRNLADIYKIFELSKQKPFVVELEFFSVPFEM